MYCVHIRPYIRVPLEISCNPAKGIKTWGKGNPIFGANPFTKARINKHALLRLLLLRYSTHVSNNRRATAGS